MKKEYESPVYHVRRVPVEKVRANSYNPNHVAPPEMKLLELSIWEDGYTMPCVFEREKGLLPVVVIEKDLSNRMASTIRHNRARGTHSVELMVDIVAELTKAGMSDEWIKKYIGMDADELLRLKQISGLMELFADKEFSIPEEA